VSLNEINIVLDFLCHQLCDQIGTHAARRTFICVALATGIPPQVVMKWTGHSDYQAMKPYIDIDIATRTKADAMQKIADNWEDEE